MIRRDSTISPGDGSACWILIPQVEHAQLAGRLAERWGAEGFAPLAPIDELLWAVDHHDDGWLAWDDLPQVDPLRARPRSFVEMELRDSLAIWGESIRVAEQAGQLEALTVAGHFCALLRRVLSMKRQDPAYAEAERFLDDYRANIGRWRQAWFAAEPRAHSPEIADRALAQLQFFDSLSLWFCCAPTTEPEAIPTPGGLLLTITPQDEFQMVLDPWPLRCPELNLEVAAWAIPAGRYANQAEIAAAPTEQVRLCWQLRPRPAKS